jgi:hypothetical protein
MGNLVLTGATSGSATVQATDAQTVTITLPASSGTLASTGANTFTADQTINTIRVGLGAGSDSSSTVVGYNALVSNTSGTANSAFGKFSLNGNTTGGSNSAFGVGSLQNTTTGSYNTAMGYQALVLNTTGGSHTAVGFQAGYNNTTGNNLTAIGYQAGYTTNVNGANVFLGFQTGYSNTTGVENNGMGYHALYYNTTGSYNVAIGDQALNFNTTGSNNIVIGHQAGYTGTTANANTFLGYQAGYTSNGSANTCLGYQTGYALTTGIHNTFIGRSPNYGAGDAITTGSKNTIVGGFSGNNNGLNISTASNNIVLSDGDGNPAIVYGALPSGAGTYGLNAGITTIGLGGSGNVNTGYLALNASSASGYGPGIQGFANGSNTWFIGSYSQAGGGTSTFLVARNSTGGVYLNGSSATSWSALSDETKKVIIEPITDAANKVSSLRAVIGRLKTDEDNVRRPYLIAQDVQKVLPEAVSELDGDEKVLTLAYTEVIPLLVAAIKELNTKVTALEAQLGAK